MKITLVAKRDVRDRFALLTMVIMILLLTLQYNPMSLPLSSRVETLLQLPLHSESLQLFLLTLELCAGLLNLLLLLGLPLLLSLELVSEKETGTKPCKLRILMET